MEFLISFVGIAIFGSIIAAIFMLQRYFVKGNRKWAWILAAVVTVLAMFSTYQSSWMYHSGGNQRDALVWQEGTYIGELQMVIDQDRHLLAVGRLVIGKTEKELEYMDLEFKDGKLTGSQEALQYKDAIEKAIGKPRKGFTGSTVSYDELNKIYDKLNEPTRIFTWRSLIQAAIFNGIFPLILWVMAIAGYRRRKSEEQLKKISVKDL